MQELEYVQQPSRAVIKLRCGSGDEMSWDCTNSNSSHLQKAGGASEEAEERGGERRDTDGDGGGGLHWQGAESRQVEIDHRGRRGTRRQKRQGGKQGERKAWQVRGRARE